jgi:hypothetical protein
MFGSKMITILNDHEIWTELPCDIHCCYTIVTLFLHWTELPCEVQWDFFDAFEKQRGVYVHMSVYVYLYVNVNVNANVYVSVYVYGYMNVHAYEHVYDL